MRTTTSTRSPASYPILSHTTVKSSLPPSNVRLSNPQHVDGSLVQLDEHAVEDLAKTEELEDFADLGADSVDTGSRKQKHLRPHSILISLNTSDR